MSARGEPRFDRDLAWGKQGELLIETYLQWVAAGNGRVEVKRKDYLDFNLYVEHEHDPGRRGLFVPSGIAVSEADVWAFVVADTGIAVLIPAALLKEALAHPSARPKAQVFGNVPTRGRLVNLAALMDVAKRMAS